MVGLKTCATTAGLGTDSSITLVFGPHRDGNKQVGHLEWEERWKQAGLGFFFPGTTVFYQNSTVWRARFILPASQLIKEEPEVNSH